MKRKTLALTLIMVILLASVGVAYYVSVNSTHANHSSISKNEAINIAMPYINQYVDENNRTVITSINATFSKSTFWSGTSWSNRPTWDIFAGFDRSVYSVNDNQYWIVGYEVVIWADNGKIDFQQSLGVM